jgi:ribosome-binding factor A
MPRDFSRSERVAAQLRRELAQLIQQEVKDPDVGFLALSDVEVTRDLAHARVFVTVFDSEHAAATCAGGWGRKCVSVPCPNCTSFTIPRWRPGSAWTA